ncbi:hypothetical protein [Nonomuraea sp. NPDC049695]|uniref:hypothetical protein n=1 Tax=Nonomuraea sp. NPDC049695 TaxID=3154734 RepID=UPI00344A1086
MQDDQERAGRPPLAGPAALTHLSGRQQPIAPPIEEAWPPQVHDAGERPRRGDARAPRDEDEDEVKSGYLDEASADREFWSDDEDDDDGDEDAEPWADLGARRRRRRIPLAVMAGAAVAGVALLVGIWSMASGEGDPAEPTAGAASPVGQPLLESPPPLPDGDGEPTDPITTVKPSRKPRAAPTVKPTKPAVVVKTSPPTPTPVVTPTGQPSPTAKPTAKSTVRKPTIDPIGPTEAPPPPTDDQDDEPPQTGPTEAPPLPGE